MLFRSACDRTPVRCPGSACGSVLVDSGSVWPHSGKGVAVASTKIWQRHGKREPPTHTAMARAVRKASDIPCIVCWRCLTRWKRGGRLSALSKVSCLRPADQPLTQFFACVCICVECVVWHTFSLPWAVGWIGSYLCMHRATAFAFGSGFALVVDLKNTVA